MKPNMRSTESQIEALLALLGPQLLLSELAAACYRHARNVAPVEASNAKRIVRVGDSLLNLSINLAKESSHA